MESEQNDFNFAWTATFDAGSRGAKASSMSNTGGQRSLKKTFRMNSTLHFSPPESSLYQSSFSADSSSTDSPPLSWSLLPSRPESRSKPNSSKSFTARDSNLACSLGELLEPVLLPSPCCSSQDIGVENRGQ